jgi:hypothetical protein
MIEGERAQEGEHGHEREGPTVAQAEQDGEQALTEEERGTPAR